MAAFLFLVVAALSTQALKPEPAPAVFAGYSSASLAPRQKAAAPHGAGPAQMTLDVLESLERLSDQRIKGPTEKPLR